MPKPITIRFLEITFATLHNGENTTEKIAVYRIGASDYVTVAQLGEIAQKAIGRSTKNQAQEAAAGLMNNTAASVITTDIPLHNRHYKMRCVSISYIGVLFREMYLLGTAQKRHTWTAKQRHYLAELKAAILREHTGGRYCDHDEPIKEYVRKVVGSSGGAYAVYNPETTEPPAKQPQESPKEPAQPTKPLEDDTEAAKAVDAFENGSIGDTPLPPSLESVAIVPEAVSYVGQFLRIPTAVKAGVVYVDAEWVAGYLGVSGTAHQVEARRTVDHFPIEKIAIVNFSGKVSRAVRREDLVAFVECFRRDGDSEKIEKFLKKIVPMINDRTDKLVENTPFDSQRKNGNKVPKEVKAPAPTTPPTTTVKHVKLPGEKPVLPSAPFFLLDRPCGEVDRMIAATNYAKTCLEVSQALGEDRATEKIALLDRACRTLLEGKETPE